MKPSVVELSTRKAYTPDAPTGDWDALTGEWLGSPSSIPTTQRLVEASSPIDW